MSKPRRLVKFYPIKPGTLYRFSDYSLKRVFPDGIFRNCDGTGKVIKRERMKKKMRRAIRRMAAAAGIKTPAF